MPKRLNSLNAIYNKIEGPDLLNVTNLNNQIGIQILGHGIFLLETYAVLFGVRNMGKMVL